MRASSIVRPTPRPRASGWTMNIRRSNLAGSYVIEPARTTKGLPRRGSPFVVQASAVEGACLLAAAQAAHLADARRLGGRRDDGVTGGCAESLVGHDARLNALGIDAGVLQADGKSLSAFGTVVEQHAEL